MLTSYLVKCPRGECAWMGSLLPAQDTDSWRGPIPTTSTAVFCCPRCEREWRARIVGDDVEVLALDEPIPTH